jgi:hypothetical protein
MKTVRFTKHAEDVLRERGLPKDLVVETVLRPDWTERETEEVWHAFRRVGEKVLRVVVKGEKEPYLVITAFFDRRLKGR